MTDIPLTPGKVRHLSADELGIAVPVSPDAVASGIADITPLDPDDPILEQVTDLLETYGGVIFVGPPGTSKSYYAARVGVTLVDGEEARIRFVQFHPSYQYEDFVEGYVPRKDGSGFDLRPKHFLHLCGEIAHKANGKPVVLVIDELSRGDPGRVFGEALTYIERSKRGMKFQLASGSSCVVPDNLVILATMNPLDRGVDEVDAALERRFAKIALDPNAELLEAMVTEAGMADDLRGRLIDFFTTVNKQSRSNPFAALGHTYFIGVSDRDGLRRVWEHQLRFHFEKAYRLDPTGRTEVFRRWDRVMAVSTNGTEEPNGEGTPTA